MLVSDIEIYPSTKQIEYIWAHEFDEIASAKNTQQPIHLKFISKKFISRIKELEQCLAVLHLPISDKSLKKISKSVGPYSISDSIARKLRSQNLQISKDGVIPYTAAIDYVTPLALELKNVKSWSLEEIQNFCEEKKLKPVAWQWSELELDILQKILHARGNLLDFWQALSAMDILASHKEPFLKISFISN